MGPASWSFGPHMDLCASASSQAEGCVCNSADGNWGHGGALNCWEEVFLVLP